MKVRTATLILLTLALGLLAAPGPAGAQQAEKVHRIGVLAHGRLETCGWRVRYRPGQTIGGGFCQGLRELGYVGGQNLSIVYQFEDEALERLPDLAADLVGRGVDVIVANTTQAALAARKATKTIPVVFLTMHNPVTAGLVRSLARPGGSITGLYDLSSELMGKRLELLKEAVPGIARVAVLLNPATAKFAPTMLREIEAVARSLGVALQILEVRDPDDFEGAFSAMSRGRAAALLVQPDQLFLDFTSWIVNATLQRHLPAIFWRREFVDGGGLMAYGASLPELGRRAAALTDKILKGAAPADLPVEQPTKFELIVNLKTFKALGLTIPPSILFRADKVVR